MKNKVVLLVFIAVTLTAFLTIKDYQDMNEPVQIENQKLDCHSNEFQSLSSGSQISVPVMNLRYSSPQMYSMASDSAPAERKRDTPMLVWIGSIAGILVAAWALFGKIAKLTKTPKDDEIYEKYKDLISQFPQWFGVDKNGKLIKRK